MPTRVLHKEIGYTSQKAEEPFKIMIISTRARGGGFFFAFVLLFTQSF